MNGPESEAARGGSEGGTEAEVDDRVLPASDPYHIDGIRIATRIEAVPPAGSQRDLKAEGSPPAAAAGESTGVAGAEPRRRRALPGRGVGDRKGAASNGSLHG